MGVTHNMGFMLLGAYLFMSGVVGVFPALQVPVMVFTILKLLAGVFIILGV